MPLRACLGWSGWDEKTHHEGSCWYSMAWGPRLNKRKSELSISTFGRPLLPDCRCHVAGPVTLQPPCASHCDRLDPWTVSPDKPSLKLFWLFYHSKEESNQYNPLSLLGETARSKPSTGLDRNKERPAASASGWELSLICWCGLKQLPPDQWANEGSPAMFSTNREREKKRSRSPLESG